MAKPRTKKTPKKPSKSAQVAPRRAKRPPAAPGKRRVKKPLSVRVGPSGPMILQTSDVPTRAARGLREKLAEKPVKRPYQSPKLRRLAASNIPPEVLASLDPTMPPGCICMTGYQQDSAGRWHPHRVANGMCPAHPRDRSQDDSDDPVCRVTQGAGPDSDASGEPMRPSKLADELLAKSPKVGGQPSSETATGLAGKETPAPADELSGDPPQSSPLPERCGCVMTDAGVFRDGCQWHRSIRWPPGRSPYVQRRDVLPLARRAQDALISLIPVPFREDCAIEAVWIASAPACVRMAWDARAHGVAGAGGPSRKDRKLCDQPDIAQVSNQCESGEMRGDSPSSKSGKAVRGAAHFPDACRRRLAAREMQRRAAEAEAEAAAEGNSLALKDVGAMTAAGPEGADRFRVEDYLRETGDDEPEPEPEPAPDTLQELCGFCSHYLQRPWTFTPLPNHDGVQDAAPNGDCSVFGLPVLTQDDATRCGHFDQRYLPFVTAGNHPPTLASVNRIGDVLRDNRGPRTSAVLPPKVLERSALRFLSHVPTDAQQAAPIEHCMRAAIFAVLREARIALQSVENELAHAGKYSASDASRDIALTCDWLLGSNQSCVFQLRRGR